MQIADRVSLWAGKKSPLPPGARWVEYLESTRTQWIDTGVLGKPTTIAEATFIWPETATGDGVLLGCRNNSISDPRFILIMTNARMLVQVGAGANWLTSGYGPYSAATLYTARSEFVASSIKFYLNGRLEISANRALGDTNKTLYVFANNSTTIDSYANARLYGLKIWQDGTLARDFRPIAIDTTGYLLDLVSGEHLPYGNKGTGELIVGPDAPAMTGGGYKRLCVKRSHRRSSRPSARSWHAAHLPRTWKEVA